MKKAIATLEKQLPDWMETAVVPGLSLALINEGEIVWAEAFGLADVEAKTPVTTETVFEAASLTKPFFATAVLQLVEANILDLDAPITTYLSASDLQAERLFEQEQDPHRFDYVPNEPRLHQLTIRQILSHTPGLQNWTDRGQPLQFYFTPGSRFSYSGNGYNLLQTIIAQYIKQSPESMLHERLIEPLGMTHSGLISAEVAGLHLATKHDAEGKPEASSQWEFMYAAASLQTTAHDFGRFLLALLNPKGTSPTLLQPATTAQMWQPQVQVNWNMAWADDWPLENPEVLPDVAWGLGWGLQTSNGRTAFWQWGNNGSFRSFALGYPDKGSAIAMFTNSANGDKLWEPILEATFSDKHPALNWMFNKRG